MNILDKIVDTKKKWLDQRVQKVPLVELEEKLSDAPECFSLVKTKKEGEPAIIAEFKRQSPSKGLIRENADLEDIIGQYEKNGASALSVLNDVEFFGAKEDDFKNATALTKLPLLRKDFIISEYQIVEARLDGASIILLIAAILEPKRLQTLAKFSKSLGMEVLLEVHSEEELRNSLNQYVDFIGVNNRNLKTFEVNIETSLKLAGKIPANFIKVTESGLRSDKSVLNLWEAGYETFLVGEYFMKEEEPGLALKGFLELFKSQDHEA